MVSDQKNWKIEEFDPRWAEFVSDPYQFYTRLQREDPVHRVRSLNSWWVTRYSDVVTVLSDPRCLRPSPTEFSGEIELPRSLVERIAEIPPNMIYSNPPAHTRLRSIVNMAFTPSLVENLRPRIQEIAQDLLKRVIADGKRRFDLIAEFAFPLPVMVISELFGLPEADNNKIRTWSGKIIRSLDKTQTSQTRIEGVQARVDFVEYLKEHLSKPHLWKRSELLSSLIARDGGNSSSTLEPGELYSMCVLLLVAAHENTTNVIGTGILTLLHHPDQLELLRNDNKMFLQAVEELLRYVSPVQRTTRVVRDDISIRDKMIAKGDIVEAVLAAANRDPEVFRLPEKFEVARTPNPHVAFGRGIHFCLGAPLARLELQIAFERLLNAFSSLNLAAEPAWKLGTSVRGLRSLILDF